MLVGESSSRLAPNAAQQASRQRDAEECRKSPADDLLDPADPLRSTRYKAWPRLIRSATMAAAQKSQSCRYGWETAFKEGLSSRPPLLTPQPADASCPVCSPFARYCSSSSIESELSRLRQRCEELERDNEDLAESNGLSPTLPPHRERLRRPADTLESACPRLCLA